MNKLTKHIDYLINTTKYRGIDVYQQSRLVDDVELIGFILKYIYDHDNDMPCRETDIEYIQLSEIYGWDTKVIRKNLFTDLDRIGLIKRSNSGKNWSRVCVTESGIDFLECDDKRLCLEAAHRNRKSSDSDFATFINRLEILIDEFNQIYWWEVWMAMRLDIDIQRIKITIINIRKEFKLKNNSRYGIETITKLFIAHNKTGVKQNGTINFENLRNKVNSFGVKATFFYFKVDNNGQYMTFKSQFCTAQNKVKRTYSRTSFVLKNGVPSDYEYHHIVPFDNAHYNQHLHTEIDSILNLIPLIKDDHIKFPNKSNFYVKLKIENERLKFYSIKDSDDFIEISNTNHLNIEKIKNMFVPHNDVLLNKVIF